MSQDETFEKFVANHQLQLEALQIPRDLWRVLSDKVPATLPCSHSSCPPGAC